MIFQFLIPKDLGLGAKDIFTGMRESARGRANEIIITLVVFGIGFLCFHPVTDDYAFFMSSLAARQFSDFAYFDVHFQGFIGIREVYKLLYYILPRINWHFIFMLVYEILSLYLVLRALRMVILKKVDSLLLISLIQIIAALFYLENIIFVSHTRVSLIFCGIALFNLAFRAVITRKEMLLNGLLFVFGMLLRPESSIGMLLIVGTGYFVYTLDLRGMIRRIWIPVLATGIFITIFSIDLAYTDIYVRKVEPEIEYKMMAKRVVDIGQMKTAKDSVKYEAAVVGMWFDMREMTPSFMRSIILPGIDMSTQHMRDVMIHLCGFYGDYPFISAVLIAFLLLAFYFLPDYKVRVARMIVFQICVAGILYALDYNGFLVSNRHFMSLQFIALFITGFYFFDSQVFKKRSGAKVATGIAFLFIILGLVATLIRYKEENTAIEQEVNDMVLTMKRLEQKYTNRLVLITIDSRFLFDQHFTLENEIYEKNTYIMFDWFTFPLSPRYVQYVSRKCNCDANDPVALFKWLSDNHALYIASPYRCDLVRRYLKAIHGCNVEFDPVTKINVLGNITNNNTDRDVLMTVRLIPNNDNEYHQLVK